MYDSFIYTYTKDMIVSYLSSKPICTGCIAAPTSVTPSQNSNKTREFLKNSRTDVTSFVRYTKRTEPPLVLLESWTHHTPTQRG